MSDTDDQQRDESGDPRTARAAIRRRRTPIVIGAVGLAAVLGGGAYVITDHLTEHGTETADVSALASPAAVPTGPATASTAATQVSASASESVAPEVRKQIDDARKKMVEDGVGVKRPIPPQATAMVDDVKISTKGSLKDGGILRMVTARGDLTGQRELAWVAGGVQKHRDVPCTQTFQFTSSSGPEKKANLLLCWLTSAKKSVVAIVVDPKGHPSRDKAVDAVEKTWRGMK
jgi:hypothetical protein